MTNREAQALQAINRYQLDARRQQLRWFAADAAKRGDARELHRCQAEALMLDALL